MDSAEGADMALGAAQGDVAKLTDKLQAGEDVVAQDAPNGWPSRAYRQGPAGEDSSRTSALHGIRWRACATDAADQALANSSAAAAPSYGLALDRPVSAAAGADGAC